MLRGRRSPEPKPPPKLSRKPMNDRATIWPELAYASWRDTAVTLQLWTQIIGKVRLALTPWMNHSWQVPFYVTARGLGTSPIPVGNEIFEVEFDFINHRLVARSSQGGEGMIPLEPQSVAEFYHWVIGLLEGHRHRRCHQRHAKRSPKPDPLLRRSHACCLPAGGGASVLAGTRPGRSCSQTLPHRLPRESEPGPFLLGWLRSRGDTLLRSFCTAPSGRARATTRGNARSLFSRGEQRRILAWQ